MAIQTFLSLIFYFKFEYPYLLYKYGYKFKMYRKTSTKYGGSKLIVVTGSSFLRKKLPFDIAVVELTIFGRNEFVSFRSRDPIVVTDVSESSFLEKNTSD